MNQRYINKFTKEDKKLLLTDSELKIDIGIKPLVDAINSIDCFVTMNSCQGYLFETEEHHCPLTYVDFYVLDHKYEVAHKLFTIIKNKLNDEVECSIKYESDFDLGNNEDVIFNGLVNLKFRIEINNNLIDMITPYNELIKIIKKYKTRI